MPHWGRGVIQTLLSPLIATERGRDRLAGVADVPPKPMVPITVHDRTAGVGDTRSERERPLWVRREVPRRRLGQRVKLALVPFHQLAQPRWL